MDVVKVLITDDHPLVRSGMRKILKDFFQSAIIYEAENGQQALNLIQQTPIDIMLLDLSMTVIDGFKLLLYLQKTKAKKFKIIVISIYSSTEVIHNLLKLGVDGYINKKTSVEKIVEAITIVLQGVLYYPEYEAEITNSIHKNKIPSIDISDKNLKIIKLLSKGKTSKQIAEELGYTIRTVETKRLRLEKKLFAKTTGELISIAYKMGILKPDEN